MVFAALVVQDQVDQHEANNKARNALFTSLCLFDFEHESILVTAHEIWSTCKKYHEDSLRSTAASMRISYNFVVEAII